MKKTTATNSNQNMLAIAVRFLMLVIAIIAFSSPQNVSAEDVCLTGPWATLPDDLCTATVTITPATRSVAPGTSVNIDLYAFTQQQWSDGGWMDVEATLSNGVTLYSGWPSGTGFGSTVSSGPLASSVTMHIWGMTNQGVFAEDTDYIDVVTPTPPNTCDWQVHFNAAGPGCMGDQLTEGSLSVGQTHDYSDAGNKWCGFCTAGPGAICTNLNVSGSNYRFSCIANAAPSVNLNFVP